jgi:hypothetical protein
MTVEVPRDEPVEGGGRERHIQGIALYEASVRARRAASRSIDSD